MRTSQNLGREALLIIDVQKGLDDPSLGRRNNPGAENNMAVLLEMWREKKLPIVHVQHCSVEPHSLLRPELPGNAIKDEVFPLTGEKLIQKSTNSAFVGTELTAFLHDMDIERLVVVGLTTDHCVSATIRSAADLGFAVTVVSDATAAFGRRGYDGKVYSGEEIHQVNLVSLQDEFCSVRSTNEIVAELSGV